MTTHHWLSSEQNGMPFANVSGNPSAVWIQMRDHETDALAKAYVPAQQALEFGQAIVAAALERGAIPLPALFPTTQGSVNVSEEATHG